MPRDSRAARSRMENVSVEEQRRAFARIEQEKADREFAMRLQAEQNQTTTPPQRGGVRRRGGRGARGRGSSSAIARVRDPVRTIRRENTSGGTGRSRQTTTTTARRGRGRQQRNPTRSRGSASATVEFHGDQVRVRRGNETIDITSATYFPDDDEDSDYSASEVDEDDDDRIDLSDSDEEESDEEGTSSYRQRTNHVAAVSADYIRQLFNRHLFPDNPRTDPLYREREDSAESDVSEGTIQIDSDDSDDDVYQTGSLHPEPNNIRQPIFEEDVSMYDRELTLYQDESEFQVPPPKASSSKADPTWGDCTMCSNTPVKPQGCTHCYQFLGCSDCVNRWYASSLSTTEGATCPLCRARWRSRPAVLLMKNIEKRRDKQTSTAPSSSSSSSSR